MSRAIKDPLAKTVFPDSSEVPDSRDQRENKETRVLLERLERKVMKVQLDIPLPVNRETKENRANR